MVEPIANWKSVSDVRNKEGNNKKNGKGGGSSSNLFAILCLFYQKNSLVQTKVIRQVTTTTAAGIITRDQQASSTRQLRRWSFCSSFRLPSTVLNSYFHVLTWKENIFLWWNIVTYRHNRETPVQFFLLWTSRCNICWIELEITRWFLLLLYQPCHRIYHVMSYTSSIWSSFLLSKKKEDGNRQNEDETFTRRKMNMITIQEESCVACCFTAWWPVTRRSAGECSPSEKN